MVAITGPITPNLWFDRDAEEAVEFYTSLFDGSRIVKVSRYGEGAPLPAGTALGIDFELSGQPFVAINGGSEVPKSHACSLAAFVETQEELDELWTGLIGDRGQPVQCGWLVDRYGYSWQVIPTRFIELTADPDPAVVERVTQAMYGMVKLDIAGLEAAAAQAREEGEQRRDEGGPAD